MKLISVALHRYKRFEQRSSMNVDSKLVAVVGPNESGKSSFLEALTHLNHTNPLNVSGAVRETTRGVNVPADRNVIEATYLLEDEDREALSGVHGGKEARWCKVSKRTQGETLYYTITPYPRRSLQPRNAVVRTLNEIPSRKGFLKLAEENEESELVASVESLASTLNTNVGTLADEEREEIQTVIAVLEDAVSGESPKYLHSLIEKLHKLYEHEKGNPVQQAMDILSRRKPRFLLFSEEERQLRSEYDLSGVWEEPPAALANLSQLAGLNLEALYNATMANDDAEVESVLEQANDRLKRQFYEVWSQSDVAVRFRTDEQVLKILVREETSGESNARFTTIAERSDGLRQFVALVAFAAVKPSERMPILLLDEVETHLHYDAQADLVQMLAKQEIAAKVIYTTHSVGCLPEDLGTGVRFIQSREPESFTSRIENAFWTSNSSGFSPLLFGMGASTLAFIPLRNAVVAEGPSDMVLWPTLLREATRRTHLDFQVVPGLSKENRPGIIVLDRQAPRTAYLLDSDDGGQDLHKELGGAGISEDKIFHIPDHGQQGVVIEDLIDAEIYVQSVNEELRRSNGDAYSFPADSLPATGRPAIVAEWCSENDINGPKKVAVAYRVLEKGVEKPVLAETYREPLRQLFESINEVLQVNPYSNLQKD